jgi:Bacillus haemolytic enterotoxin (HBL)
MTQIPNIGPALLSIHFQTATNSIMLLSMYSDMVLEQVALDLGSSVDAGLAYQIQVYQTQMKLQARSVAQVFTPSFIAAVSDAQNYCSLWSATSETVLPALTGPDSTPGDLSSVAGAFQTLGKTAGTCNQNVAALSSSLKTYKQQLDNALTPLQSAVTTAISSMSDSAKALLSNIDTLNASIQQNIQDIVAGADKVGTATSELLTGILTTISGAKQDPKKGGDKGGDKGKDGDGPAKSNETAGTDGGGGGDKPLPTDFAVTSIQGASQGSAETAQARADLNFNNVNLAAAYQQLAADNALIAVAKVVLVQNQMFVSGLADSMPAIPSIATDWGVPPPIAPPGSGISQAMYAFATAVNSVATGNDGQDLADQIEYQNKNWDLLSTNTLSAAQGTLTGGSLLPCK